MDDTALAGDILAYWFGPRNAERGAARRPDPRWFVKDPAFDAEIRARYGDAIEAALGGAFDAWTGSEYSSADSTDNSVRLVYGDLDYYSLESETDFAARAKEFWSMFDSSCDVAKTVTRVKRGSAA